MSDRFVYALTSDTNIHAYDYGGSEVASFSLSGPVITIFAFQHLLGVVTMKSLPVEGHQKLEV